MGFLKDLSEKDRLFYSKVVLGSFMGLLAGILNVSVPQLSVFALWLLAFCALMLLGLFARNLIGIEDMEPARVYLSGTFTYFLFFLLIWVVFIMVSAPEHLLPPGELL